MAGKKDKVKDEDRFSIITEDMTHCYICGCTGIELHEVFHGTANRKKSKQEGTVIPLCKAHHTGQYSAHNSQVMDTKLKQIAEAKWLEYYNKNVEDFIKEFGKNYLEV